ncbi:hypothetical protein C9374_002489 [Naegleria lovaniensis]|uniref:Uncharacterized protein n=1 Tax=Naegleria lovaniensis TaxID=51637 RepID=A0AA88GTS1_NAELO|nr:uncharacterized protein C9374_002489 [Naegleria lovaniensis]KAG2386745.1 hypothetical protein C9374_002489 [Naegleria lovaniensis]
MNEVNTEEKSELFPDFLLLPQDVQDCLLQIKKKPKDTKQVSTAVRAFHSLQKKYANERHLLTPSFYHYILYIVAKKHKHLPTSISLAKFYYELGVMSTLSLRYFLSCFCTNLNQEYLLLQNIWNFLLSGGKIQEFSLESNSPNHLSTLISTSKQTTRHYRKSSDIKSDIPIDKLSFKMFLCCLLERYDLNFEDSSFDQLIIEGDKKLSEKLGYIETVPLHVKVQYVLLHMIKLNVEIDWKHYRVLLFAYIRENKLEALKRLIETLFQSSETYNPLSVFNAEMVPGYSSMTFNVLPQETKPLKNIQRLLSVFLNECSKYKRPEMSKYLLTTLSQFLDSNTKSINTLLNNLIELGEIQALDVFEETKKRFPNHLNIATLAIVIKGYSFFVSRTKDPHIRITLFEKGKQIINVLSELKLKPDEPFLKSYFYFLHTCNPYVDISEGDIKAVTAVMNHWNIAMNDRILVSIMMALCRNSINLSYFTRYLKTAKSINTEIVNWALTTCYYLKRKADSVVLMKYYTTDKANSHYLAPYSAQTFNIYFNIWKSLVLSDQDTHDYPIQKIIDNMETCFEKRTIEPTADLLSSLGSVMIKFMQLNRMDGETMLKKLTTIISKYYPRELIACNPRFISLFLSTVVSGDNVDMNVLNKAIELLETYDEDFLDVVHYTQLLRIINLSPLTSRMKLMKPILDKMAQHKQYPNSITLRMIVEIILKEAPHMRTLIQYILLIMKTRAAMDIEGIDKKVRGVDSLAWIEQLSKLLNEYYEHDTTFSISELLTQPESNNVHSSNSSTHSSQSNQPSGGDGTTQVKPPPLIHPTSALLQKHFQLSSTNLESIHTPFLHKEDL